MVDRLKIMCNKNSYGNLVEEIIMIAIESALEEISEKIRTRLECRYNWLGDTEDELHESLAEYELHDIVKTIDTFEEMVRGTAEYVDYK